MAYVHDDDDPFYDHDEALAEAAASRTSALASAPVRPSAFSRTPQVSTVRVSHQTAGQPTTLSRSTSAGRSTTTFDAFLSDSSDDDSDDDDDGTAIQRMQEQADDMEYIDTAFQLDSPNSSLVSSDATSVRVEPPELLETQRSTVVPTNDAAAQASASGSAAWARRMSRAVSQHSDRSSDASTDSAVTRPFAGHRDSVVETRARDASVDTLDSSFRLFSPTAAFAAVAARSVDSASYLSSGDFSDSSFVLSSPPPVSGSSATYFDDDSFTSVRPSALDALFDERLDDDSFTGDRPSIDDSFASARLSQDSRASIDDSFASRRPSNLSQESRASASDSFVSARPSNLSSSSSRGSVDKSVVGPRSSASDRASRSSIDNAFIGERPVSLLQDARDDGDVHRQATESADSLGESDDDDEPLSLLHVPEGIDASIDVAPFRLSSPNALRRSDNKDAGSSPSADDFVRASMLSALDAPVDDDALALASVAVAPCDVPTERHSSTQALAVETHASAAAVVVNDDALGRTSSASNTSSDDALALSYLSDPPDAAVDSVASVFQLESPNRQSALIAMSAHVDPAPALPLAVEAPSAAAAEVTNDVSVSPARRDEPVAVASPAPPVLALERQRLLSVSAETAESSVTIKVQAPLASASAQSSVAAAKPESGVASWVRRLSRLAPSDDSNDSDVEGSESDSECLDASPQWAFAALSEQQNSAPSYDARAPSVHSVTVPPPPLPLRPTAQSTTTASGFQWHEQMTQRLHADSRSDESSSGGGLSLKESIWHQASIPRPTRPSASAMSFHRFSMSLRSTLERTGARLFGHSPPQPPPFGQPTSPKSVCSSPPKLARSFDDRNFYARFARGGGVDDTDELLATKRALGRQYTTASVLQKRRARTAVLLLCALLGIGVGIVLIHIDAFAAALTPGRGRDDDAVAIATQWLLLPGTLFLRLWHCITMPLVFCHVLTGTADLVLNGKAHMALSARSIGYMLAVSAVTTLEGVGLMATAQYAGLFRPSPSPSSSVETTAAELRTSLGAVAYPRGTVALLCESEQRTYLQSLNRGQSFQCSNASSLSTVAAAPSIPSPALFVLHDVHSALRSEPLSTSLSASYYPRALSLDDVSHSVVDALVPHNMAQSLLDATPVTTIALALLLGLVCGKRAFDRAIAAQHEDTAAAHSASRGAGTPFLGATVADKPHYVLGAVVELQLALEWLVEALEPLAPVGALSLLTGTIALYRTELLTFVAPMLALVLSVTGACLVHVLVVTPIGMKLCADVNVVATWGQTFVPAYAMCFSTESVVLSLPTVQQCYATQSAAVRTKRSGLTKSMAQASVSVLSALHRNGHALYYPLALLWLLESGSSAGAAALSIDQCALIAAWTLASCFVALHSVVGAVSSRPGRSNVLLIVTLWRAVLASGSSNSALSTAMPPTLPLLIACDVLLSRVVAMVNLHGNMVVARLIGEHCDEVVVQGTAPSNSIDLAPSPVYL